MQDEAQNRNLMRQIQMLREQAEQEESLRVKAQKAVHAMAKAIGLLVSAIGKDYQVKNLNKLQELLINGIMNFANRILRELGEDEPNKNTAPEIAPEIRQEMQLLEAREWEYEL